MPQAAQVNVVYQGRTISSPRPDNDVYLAGIGLLMRRAIEASGRSYKEIAIAVNVPPSYLTRMLDDEKPWRLAQLESIPDDVKKAFARLHAESLGLTVQEPDEEAKAIAQLIVACGQVVATFQRRMLPEKAKALKAEMK